VKNKKARPTAKELAKAISDIALFPAAVSVFYDAQIAGLCGMLDEDLVARVKDASSLFRLRNDAEHMRSINSVQVDSGESLED